MRYVFVHGIGQEGRSPDALKAEWLDCLSGKIEDAQIPYYGDALARWVTRDNDPDFKTRGATDDFNKFLVEYGTEALGNGSIEAAVAAMHPDEAKRGIQNGAFVTSLVRLLDRLSPEVAQMFIQKFLRSVHTYLTNSQAQKEIDDIVRAALQSHESPTTIVAHSLGTVVTYNVLRSDNFPHVKRLITLGSPLAINAVAKRLTPKSHSTSTERWINCYDRADIVALNPLSKPPLESICSIENRMGFTNDSDNHHGIAGYLKVAPVAHAIFD